MSTDLVFQHNDSAVTSTLVIAEQTENQHKNVLELVRKYQTDFEEFGRVAFETRPFETAGGMQRMELALLNEPQSTLLITYLRNGPVVRQFKKRLVTAFYEFANRVKHDLPQDYLSALKALTVEVEAKQLALEQIAADAPKVEFHDRVTQSEDLLTIREAAKVLRTGERRLFEFLRKEGMLMRSNLPYQDFMNRDLFRVVETPWTDAYDRERISTKTCLTQKGLAYVRLLQDKLALFAE